jgi:hypothetical protein
MVPSSVTETTEAASTQDRSAGSDNYPQAGQIFRLPKPVDRNSIG